ELRRAAPRGDQDLRVPAHHDAQQDDGRRWPLRDDRIDQLRQPLVPIERGAQPNHLRRRLRAPSGAELLAGPEELSTGHAPGMDGAPPLEAGLRVGRHASSISDLDPFHEPDGHFGVKTWSTLLYRTKSSIDIT